MKRKKITRSSKSFDITILSLCLVGLILLWIISSYLETFSMILTRIILTTLIIGTILEFIEVLRTEYISYEEFKDKGIITKKRHLKIVRVRE